MSFFNQFHRKGSQANHSNSSSNSNYTIRKVVEAKSVSHNVTAAQAKSRVKSKQRSSTTARSDAESAVVASRSSVKRRAVARKRRSELNTPTQLSSDSSDDSSDGEDILETQRKRLRTSLSQDPDPNRKLRSHIAFLEGFDKTISFINATDIVSHEKTGKYIAVFPNQGADVEYSLQYPSVTSPEQYPLLQPHEDDGFSPVDDTICVVDLVLHEYFSEELSKDFIDASNGIPRRLRRAVQHGSENDFREAIEEYNDFIKRHTDDGTIERVLDKMHTPSLPLVGRILTQVYSRTVSPRVAELRQYENGTDYVYGELLPRFVSEIFKETGLHSHQTFVDLGSGVGNAVLQAALEIGCQSYGCEIMENACDLAELQEKEFGARCRLWGLEPGQVRLERGDFLKNATIGKVLQKADVVLVNNQAFTPALNDNLISLFLDLKEGCQIVSLRSFVPAGHQITARNRNSPINVLLDVREKTYWSGYVSWTNAGGSYYIVRKDSSKLKEFDEDMKQSQ